MEGLRGIGCTAVVVFHVYVLLAADVDAGVLSSHLDILSQSLTLFFALSGFLLYRSFAKAILTGERFPSIGRFARNRSLRMFPVHTVILLITSLAIGSAYYRVIVPGDSGGVPDSVGYLTDPVKLIANIFMVQSLFPGTIRTGLGVSWSLTVELSFYFALPLLAMAAFRWRRRRRSLRGGVVLAIAPAAVLLAIGLAGKTALAQVSHPTSADEQLYLEYGGNWTAVLARSFLVQADLFAFGMLAAVVVALFSAGVLPIRLVTPTRWGGLVVAAAVVALTEGTPYRDTGFAVLTGAVFLFAALPLGTPGIVARALDCLPLRFLGEISYSMYLWHCVVIWTLYRHGWTFPATLPGLYANIALVFAVSVCLSAITYYGVERPALRFKRRTDGGRPSVVQPASREVGPHAVPSADHRQRR